MYAQQIKTKDQAEQLMVESIDKTVHLSELVNPSGLAKFIDYDMDKMLELTEEKTELCKRLITDINSYYKKYKKTEKREFLRVLKDNILGKLFYISLQEHKYLMIDKLSTPANKQDLLKMIEVIELSETSAVFLLDQMYSGDLRNFLNGIISYLY